MALALFLVFSIFGWCGHSPSDAKIADVLLKLSAAGVLTAQRSKAGRAFAFYVKRRAKRLLEKNPDWADESDYHRFRTRVGAEIDRVASYVSDRLGTPESPGPLGGATDPTLSGPRHLDLADMAKRRTVDGADDVAIRRDRFIRERRRRVEHIIWRATALQPELWMASEQSLVPTLNVHALDELVDRRLRIVERLSYNDQPDFNERIWTIDGPNGPWRDSFRTAIFEYQFIKYELNDQKEPSADDPFVRGLTAAGLTTRNLAPFVDNGLGELRHPSTRIRPSAAENWRPDEIDPYWFRLAAGSIPASVAMDRLIPPAEPMDPTVLDFWQRNWIFCDHMLAALHIEATRFARRRRTGGDSEFDAAVGSTGLVLRPLIPISGAPDPSWLMSGGAAYFEGVAISANDLQIGDHVVYWNNGFVREILGSDFGLENALVMDIVDEGVDVSFGGHGMSELGKDAFADALAQEVQSAYSALREHLLKQLEALPDSKSVEARWRKPSGELMKFLLVRWSPYGEQFEPADDDQLQVLGAWWIRVKLSQTSDANHHPFTMEMALGALPSSVRVDLAHHVPPPLPDEEVVPGYQEAVYLPLSLPRGIRGRWPEYMRRRNADEAFFGPIALDDIPADKELIPGFFRYGHDTKIPVLRPKVIP